MAAAPAPAPAPPAEGVAPTGEGEGKRWTNLHVMTLEPVISKLEKFILYETVSYMYVVGCDKRQSEYRVLKLDRGVRQPQSLSDILSEDDGLYTKAELKDMLEMIHEGNRSQGGLVRVATGYGILGFVRFLGCYYLNLITQRRKVGSIGGNNVYGIKATELFPIKPAQKLGDESWGRQMVGAVNRRLNPTQREIAEQRNLGLFQFIDLTKDFYFSYTYDLTNSLQHNMTAATSKTFPLPPCKDMYSWNLYLTRELEVCVGELNASYWVLPIIHGAFLQRKCTMFGRLLNIMLIGRRSRHFAGTRYLKRGVSDCGKVANDVELEQIVHEESVGEGNFSSFLQVRGSIPTFWTQETSVTMPKPPIVLNRVDPTYAASQLHFGDLLERYSSPVLVLDLTKHSEKREREMIVASEFRRAIDHLNGSVPPAQRIPYCALDFSHLSKHRQLNVLKALDDVARWALRQTGFFCSTPRCQILANGEVEPVKPLNAGPDGRLRPFHVQQSNAAKDHPQEEPPAPPHPAGPTGSLPTRDGGVPELKSGLSVQGESNSKGRSVCGGVESVKFPEPPPIPPVLDAKGKVLPAMEQRGVLRTNCIDCLDRTNVAQFTVGVHALGQQLATMGMRSSAVLESGSQVVLVLMDLYSIVGDQIALQYGGSEAHKKVASGSGSTRPVGSSQAKHKEFLTSIRRYYSNAFTDRLKQDAMNVFLGHYVASEHEVPLWELDNDYYLHNFHVQTGSLLTMHKYSEPWHDDHLESYGSDSSEDEATARFTQEGEESAGEAAGHQEHQDDPPGAPPPGIVADGSTSKSPATSPASGPEADKELGGDVDLDKGRSTNLGDSSDRTSFDDQPQALRDGVGGGEVPKKEPTATSAVDDGPASKLAAAQDGGDALSKRQQRIDRKRRKRRVRHRCQQQVEASALWWLQATTKFSQQRLWMRLGPPPASRVMNRFERTHQPYKLTQFDKIFSHEFQVPIPLAHAAGASDNSRSQSYAGPSRLIDHDGNPRSGSGAASYDDESVVEDDRERVNFIRLVRDLFPRVGRKGVGRRSNRSSHQESLDEGHIGDGGTEDVDQAFIGFSAQSSAKVEEFKQYAKFAAHPELHESVAINIHAEEEFKQALWEMNLDPDDVTEIKTATDRAHCSKFLKTGPYKGLEQNETARLVSAVVSEQVMRLTGEESSQGPSVVNGSGDHTPSKDQLDSVSEVLQQSGLAAPGVKDQIACNLHTFDLAQDAYKQQLDPASISLLKSSVTDQEGMEVYCSFFQHDNLLNDNVMHYVINSSAQPTRPRPQRQKSVARPAPLGGELAVENTGITWDDLLKTSHGVSPATTAAANQDNTTTAGPNASATSQSVNRSARSGLSALTSVGLSSSQHANDGGGTPTRIDADELLTGKSSRPLSPGGGPLPMSPQDTPTARPPQPPSPSQELLEEDASRAPRPATPGGGVGERTSDEVGDDGFMQRGEVWVKKANPYMVFNEAGKDAF